MEHQKTEDWPIDKLSANPRQAELFRQPTDIEVHELAADLKANGQLSPIEALPDGTLIAGHKRVQAARKLGWEKIRVWVREDLDGKPHDAAKRHIEDNLNRRQLGPIEMAKCYHELKLLAVRLPGSRLADSQKRDLRDQIGKRLGVSGRMLDRYLRILKAPPEVQAAVNSGTMSIVLAGKAADLNKKQRDKFADSIRRGVDAPRALKDLLSASPPSRHFDVHALLAEFDRALDGIEEHHLDGSDLTPDEEKTLRKMEGVVAKLSGHSVRTRCPKPTSQ